MIGKGELRCDNCLVGPAGSPSLSHNQTLFFAVACRCIAVRAICTRAEAARGGLPLNCQDNSDAPLLHGLSQQNLVLVIKAEGVRIFRGRPLETDFGNGGEVGRGVRIACAAPVRGSDPINSSTDDNRHLR